MSIDGIGQGGRRARYLIPMLNRVQKNDEDASVRDSANRALQKLQNNLQNSAEPGRSWIGWATAFLLTVITAVGIYHWFQTSDASRKKSALFRQR